MALNIKSDETVALVRELSAATGETLTTAITVAVRERLDRVRDRCGDDLADRLLAMGRECAAHMSGPGIDHGELLYDERGLPR
jgi:antitoxin VapB